MYNAQVSLVYTYGHAAVLSSPATQVSVHNLYTICTQTRHTLYVLFLSEYKIISYPQQIVCAFHNILFVCTDFVQMDMYRFSLPRRLINTFVWGCKLFPQGVGRHAKINTTPLIGRVTTAIVTGQSFEIGELAIENRIIMLLIQQKRIFFFAF